MPAKTSFTSSDSTKEPWFYLTRVPGPLKRKVEARRLKLGHNKKEAVLRMIEMYLNPKAIGDVQ